MLHKAKIEGFAIDQKNKTPIILLKTEEGEQTIPIWIGMLEATSIASALQDIKYERPMTHDLFKNFSDSLKISIAKIEVCDLKDNTFFARIYFVSKDGNFDIDARPSDAIALALRFSAPIFVEDAVMQKSKISDGEAEVVDTSEEGKKWADYLEKLSPDEFGKYKV